MLRVQRNEDTILDQVDGLVLTEFYH